MRAARFLPGAAALLPALAVAAAAAAQPAEGRPADSRTAAVRSPAAESPDTSAVAPVALPAAAVPAVTDTLVLAPRERTACLTRRPVLPSTVTVTLEGVLLDGVRDFGLDAGAGCLTVLIPDSLGMPRTLVVTYGVLPLALQSEYRRHVDPHVTAAETAVPVPETAPGPQPFVEETPATDLTVSGSKTFGVELGSNRDLKLRQSLDLRLSGQVAENATLLAILSDQDLPFQPEGNTAELEELDKVLVELRTPGAAASLGDVEVHNQGTRFLDLERQLEGFRGDVAVGGSWSRAAFAGAKGEFRTESFFGTEGLQGPYLLPDRAGASGVAVVAGSERVWLDGVLLARGEEQDYVIDYSLGEVTFTSRHPIGALSKITVDYEYSTARYKRRVLFAGNDGIDLGRGGTLRAAVFSETDDGDDPLGGALTQAERDELAALGDSAQAIDGGTAYVGPGLGDYELLLDSETGNAVFVFVDGQGDYRVAFVDVGEDQGNYEVDPLLSSQSRIVYRYAGESRGPFIVRRDLPAPVTLRAADLRYELAGRGGRLTAEGAVSDRDGNTLSARDDGDNEGGAVWVEGRTAGLGVAHGVALTPSFRWRKVGANFRSPQRFRESFYGRDWNLSGTREIGAEDLVEGGLETAWAGGATWIAEVGRLALADTSTSVRQRQTLAYERTWLSARAGWLTVRQDETGAAAGPVDGAQDKITGDVRLRRWPVQPRGQFSHEVRTRPGRGEGERFREWETALGFPVPATGLNAEVGVGRRLDDGRDTVDVAWDRARDTRRTFFTVDGAVKSLAVGVRYEDRRIYDPDGNREDRDVGRFDLRHQALRGSWTASTTLDLGTVGLRVRAKTIVPDSTGFYDMFGNYVGAGGGYDVRYSGFPDEPTTTSRVNLAARLRWSPRGDDTLPRWTQKVAWEGYVNLNESSLLPLGSPGTLLSPGSYLNPQSTLDGALRERQTFDFLPLNREFGVQLRQDLDRQLRNSSTTGGTDGLLEERSESILAAVVRTAPGPGWTAEAEGSRGTREESVGVSGSSFEQRTRFHDGTLRGGKRIAPPGSSLRFSAEVTYSTETGEGKRAEGWSARPRVQWTWTKVGRLDLRYAHTVLTVSEGFTALRGAGAPRLTPGRRLDLVAEARVRQGITVTGTLGVTEPEGFRRVTEGRMEVRGTF